MNELPSPVESVVNVCVWSPFALIVIPVVAELTDKANVLMLSISFAVLSKPLGVLLPVTWTVVLLVVPCVCPGSVIE